MMQHCYLTKLESTRLPQAKASLPTRGCGEGKVEHVCQGTSQGEQEASALKASTPRWLSEKVFLEGNIWDEGCSMWTFSDWLVVRLQVDVSRTAIIHPSSQSGV